MVEQIYKNLFKDEKGKYLFADDNDTRYIVSQESLLLVYLIEILLKDGDKKDPVPFLSNKMEDSK